MPITNGIPQWRSLSYQCIPRTMESNVVKSQHITTQLMESSFIGECKPHETHEISHGTKLDFSVGGAHGSKSR